MLWTERTTAIRIPKDLREVRIYPYIKDNTVSFGLEGRKICVRQKNSEKNC